MSVADPGNDRRAGRSSLTRIFAVPAALFAISLAGLIVALLVEGWADAGAALAAASGLGGLAWTSLRTH